MVKLLVIDDETDTLILLKSIFKKKGVEVQTLSTGSLALEMAEKYHPDIILLDINLDYPYDGRKISKQIKANQQTSDIKIYLCSAQSPDLSNYGVKVDGFIQKPFNITELKKAVLSQ